MNNDLEPNTVEDTENNNVDENSNDHQYNEYANYHNQFTDHQFRRHIVQNDVGRRASNVEQEEANRAQYYQRAGIHRSQNSPDTDTVDRVSSRVSFSQHRRNMSEDLSINSNQLPQLPRNIPNGPHNHRETRYSQSNDWMPLHYRRRHRFSEEEIRNQGQDLFYEFTAEQFREENLNLYDYLETSPNPRSWQKEGRSLRMLADEFSRSQERRELRYRAQQVNMSSLTCENFFQLCRELFHRDGGGITQERIVVLFTFISDIAIQQVRQRAERFISELMQWSLHFIYDHICAWVQEAGGWAVVLNRGLNLFCKLAIFAFAAVSVVALGVYIKKNWKEV